MELGKRLKLRAMPEIIFELDESIEKGMELQQTIDNLRTMEHDGE